MKKNTGQTKYFLYARKSTESEDRQVLSIESQIDELKRIARRDGLDIVEVLFESRSAKTLGRPIFNEMLDRVTRGEARGILCWKLDRLARNFIDGGKIIELLQQGVIEHIRSFERDYYPEDNVLLMSVEFGQANQFSRDLAVNVSRGMRKKAEMGWYPSRPPLGYLNSKINGKGSNDIFKDSKRFDLVRKGWDFMLTGQYTAPRLLEIMSNEWGLTTRRGHKMSKSNIYELFTNPFYYGMYEFPKKSGNWYRGSHESMITEEEYDKVQIILGKKGKPRPKSYVFTFAGTMKCACGLSITAEEKRKRQKNGTVHHYVYYHCTRKRTPKCVEGVVEEGRIKGVIAKELSELKIPDEFHQWALKWIERENGKEVSSRNIILATQRKAYDDAVKMLDNLITMRAREEITEEEFREKKGALLKEKARLNELLNDTDHCISKWAEDMTDGIAFAIKAKSEFEDEKTSIERKRQILLSLGSNPILKDRKLIIDLEETLMPMKKLASAVQEIHAMFEPQKIPMKHEDLMRLYSESTVLSAQQGSNLRPLA